MILYKVNLPTWWTEGEQYDAYSDMIDTYCCDATPAWFVQVFKNKKQVYAGYFKRSDLSRDV